MPVLIGAGGGPTLGQHKYNRAYFHQIAIHVKNISEMSLVKYTRPKFNINYLGR